ncbi:MAG: tetratricopeptide repeat protein [Pseudomonadales bacterium]|nr:tetratricopeptide repeat protein [Pseudomonadales bacterium]MDC3358726.1 tetratricopeptide repeat protein [Pseudomonadales bacterium]MDG0999441.1 tetratricopeptide repeat protein [Pseudomonadales bacterium]MDG1306421.1 tetratricopeptide repeat protein [Pseudomonadales bacterium]MDG1835235.1 tetratricopeptide repeat protein [Pseudomonadales bacterium]|tara:strand:- start:127 stop:981 length:855 start_codon:yes stop_codon:yes gene_type:complete
MNASPNIIEVSVQNFQTEVVEKSQQIPVFLEFYADGAEPSEQLAPILNKLATEFSEKIILARVDVQQNQQIVQQLAVRTLPTVKVIFQGQMAQDLEGPQEEATLREMIEQLTMSSVERIREQIKVYLAQGHRAEAIELLQQVISEEPHNHALQTELSDLLIMENRIDEAKLILASLPTDAEGISKPQNRVAFIELANELPPLAELLTAREANEDDLQLQYDTAVRLIADDQIEAALEGLLVMLKKDKSFDDELARKTMIKVFELLGKGDAMATAYRRKMFTFLH